MWNRVSHFPIHSLGRWTLDLIARLGSVIIFFMHVCYAAWKYPIKWASVVRHIHFIGVQSISVILVTGISSGSALALQCYIGFYRVGAEHVISLIVALGLARELAPMLTSLMATGRAGSAMAAEIGSMRISEQIDALRTLCIDPLAYLIVPRMIASIIAVPLLTLIALLFGMIGAYVFCVYIVNIPSGIFAANIAAGAHMSDVVGGLIKSSCFGLIMAWISCYYGYNAQSGARGVGVATTDTVVVGSICILVANYMLSALMFYTGLG